MNKIKLGFVGGGKESMIGILHRVAAYMCEKYEITGGVFSSKWDQNLRFSKELHLNPKRVYIDLATFIREERSLPDEERISTVSILTPNSLHFSMAKDLITNGFNVICEKPMTMTYEEALEIEDLATSAGVKFAVTYTYTGYPMVREMKHLIRSGKIGAIQRIDAQYYQGWINPIIHEKEKRNAVWRLNPEKSGISCCMGDIGTHAFDMVEYITGMNVKEILADLNYLYDNNPMDIDGTVLMRFDGKTKGVLKASQIATGEENNFRVAVYGKKGSLKWHQENPNQLEYLSEGGAKQILMRAQSYNSTFSNQATKIAPGHPEGIFDAMGNIYQGVAKSILGVPSEEGEFPTIDQGIRGMKFIEQAIASHQEGNIWKKL